MLLKLDLFLRKIKKYTRYEFSPFQDNTSKLKDQVLRIFFLEQVKGLCPVLLLNLFPPPGHPSCFVKNVPASPDPLPSVPLHELD